MPIIKISSTSHEVRRWTLTQTISLSGVTFMLSIISFIHERTTGTLARLLSTPVTEGEVVMGYVVAFGFIGLIQSMMVMATALLLFNVQVERSLLLVLLTIFLLGVGMQGLGFLLSANARTEFQAIQFIPLILFPSMLLSGVFWPVQAVPEVLRPISYFLPLTYAVDGARSVMVRGWGLEHIWPDLALLTLFAVAMLLLSVLLMKRRR
ncbi:MAG TPA: ABC transporter permease [Methanomassiliicoccales archaeon]|nr:ABC transporter permease [Methanomassiliicoccales archaeon]